MKAFVLSLLFFACLQIQAQSLDSLFQEVKNDLERQDLEAAFSKLEEIDRIRPHHPVVVRQLLEVAAKRFDTTNTLKYLKRSILIQGDPALLQKTEYDFVRGSEEFVELEDFVAVFTAPVAHADTAFLLPDPGLHPESIAYDSNSGNFFVSSIRQRKIVRINPEGNEADFTVSPALWAVSGLAVNQTDKILWATTCAIPEMQNFLVAEEGNCRLVKISIQTGEIIESYSTDDTEKHHWGDLAVASNGDVYISDSAQPVLYLLKKGTKSVTVFKSLHEWLNLQGLCFSSDQKYLYVSDYIKGLYRIEIAQPTNTIKLDTPEDFLAKGIDGLYFYQNTLLVIQNGVQPFRVAKLQLNSAGDAVTDFKYLEKGTARMGEPTLGTLVNDRFYFIANSPWGYYKEGILDVNSAPQPLIMKVELE